MWLFRGLDEDASRCKTIFYRYSTPIKRHLPTIPVSLFFSEPVAFRYRQ
jgi:hypothetical protein